MIKEAINRILELGVPNQIERDGQLYVDRDMRRIRFSPRRDTYTVHSLTGLIDFINLTGFEEGFVSVIDADEVRWISDMNELELDRSDLCTAEFDAPSHRFGEWLDQESFVIWLQTRFIDTPERAKLLKVVGNVVSQTEVQTKDDGVSTSVTARSGIARVEEIDLPSPINLKPIRTFYEIDQIESPFVLRGRKSNSGPQFALFDADGGKWRNDAVQAIVAHLKGIVKDIPVIG